MTCGKRESDSSWREAAAFQESVLPKAIIPPVLVLVVGPGRNSDRSRASVCGTDRPGNVNISRRTARYLPSRRQ